VSLPPDHPLHGRRRAPAFRPSFTLALLYLLAFFLLYAFLLILPELLTVLRDVPAGPEQQQIAQETAHRVARPRLAWAVALALGSVGLGAWLQVLPGLRSPGS
jgi:hypothetical protein